MKTLELRKLIREEVRKALKESNKKPIDAIGDMIDNMQDDEDGLDQGLKPSELINYEAVALAASKQGIKIDIQKLKKLAKANDSGFMYSGAELLSQSMV